MDLDNPITILLTFVIGMGLIIGGAFTWQKINPQNQNGNQVTLKVLMLEHGDEWHNVSYAYLDHVHDDRYALIIHWHNDTYALVSHRHDDLYALLNHTHSEYAPIIHWHNETYALVSHNHDDLYALLTHLHDDRYALINHLHDDRYAYLVHWHNNTYALISHLHDDRYALIDHNHDGVYALLTHLHDNRYALITHDHNDLYYTKSQINAILTNYYTKNEIDAVLANYYTKSQTDALLAQKSKVTAVEASGTGSYTVTGNQVGDILVIMYRGCWEGATSAIITLKVRGVTVDSLSVRQNSTSDRIPFSLIDVYTCTDANDVSVSVSTSAGSLGSYKVIVIRIRG